MIKRIDGMPGGTVGLEGSRQADPRGLSRRARAGAARRARGRRDAHAVRAHGFDGLAPGAWVEDAKTGLSAIVQHHSSWRRLALVTDVEWIRKSTRAFAWLVPGELLVRDLDGLEEARDWVAG